MFATVKLKTKRWMLMRPFKCYEVKYQAEKIGAAMAREDRDSQRDYHREELQDVVQTICAKKNIGRAEMNMIEEDLNDYINGLVRAAFDAEAKKIEMRKVVEGRIKIKRVEGLDLDRNSRSSES